MKKKLVIILAVILTSSLLLTDVIPVSGRIDPGAGWVSKSLSPISYYYGCGTGIYECGSLCTHGACGPASGVAIGWYYKTRDRDGNGVPDYPIPLLSTRDKMYDALYDYMDTSPIFVCYTDTHYYGYGFLEMMRRAGYYNFSFVAKGKYSENECWGGEVNSGDFWNIVNAIDNGWPVALVGNFKDVPARSGNNNGYWPPNAGHYIVIRGYKYYDGGSYTSDYRIICTDNWCESNELVLDWNVVVQKTLGLQFYIIKDEIPEDFEWGSDGVSLGTDGGDVDWTVTASGGSYAQIDDDVRHYSAGKTRSGKFYRDGSNFVRAYYSEYRPIWRGFWLRRDGNTVFYTRTGDGSHSILVRVLDDASGGTLQYYDGGWKDTRGSITDTQWHFIEFRVIDWWGPYRYDYSIYVDNNWVKSGVPMYTETAYNGITAYYSDSGSGSFWIDDIP